MPIERLILPGRGSFWKSSFRLRIGSPPNGSTCSNIPAQAASAASMSPRRDSGESLGAKRLITLPSLPTRNLVKFHLIVLVPRIPGASDVSHFQSLGALSPLTSTLLIIGNVTP